MLCLAVPCCVTRSAFEVADALLLPAPAEECDVSPVRPACETLLLAALASPAVYIYVGQPSCETIDTMCKEVP